MKIKNSILFSAFIALMAIITNASAQSQPRNSYKLDKVTYRIADPKTRSVLETEMANTELKSGQVFNKQIFEKERERIARVIKERVDPSFDEKRIKFLVDTTKSRNLFSVETVIAKNK